MSVKITNIRLPVEEPESELPSVIARRLGVQADEIVPFPNPYNLSGSTASLLFTRPATADSLTEMIVYNEFGIMVDTVTLALESEDWSWNLTNADDNLLLPGMYFLKSEGQPVKSLLVLSGK